MIYDAEEIAMRVDKKRKVFLKKIGIISFLIISALAVIILNLNDYATVLCVLAEIPLILSFARSFTKHGARTLFSREVSGKNLKEYEYNIYGYTQSRIYHRGIAPRTNVNRKNVPLRLNGTVYLELEDGNIVSLNGLYKSHMDIYEEGDILLKYAGTKFPIVINREVLRQPCPICGEVNDRSTDFCKACGLRIVKKRS